MAFSYETVVFSQNSVYNENNQTNEQNRKLKVYYSSPDKGVNEDTGFLLLIAGYNGNASSNVYKKMRNKFSDEYNLITIQCDYFGYEFMQNTYSLMIKNNELDKINKVFSEADLQEIYKSGNIDLDTLLDLGNKYNITLDFYANLSNETLDNFNDMGLMQAIDNITAVLSVMNIFYDNDMVFNSKKVILYGHSHGAYLSYLCNAFAPRLFSLIIDNSAYLYPVYVIAPRSVYKKFGSLTIQIYFNYLYSKITNDIKILFLPFLYSNFTNNCQIISYHGTNDKIINSSDKSAFCNNINNCIYNEISPDKVDQVVFKSTQHVLDADFLELFYYTMNNFNIHFEKSNIIDLDSKIIFVTQKNKYVINYENIIPQLSIHKLYNN